MNRRQRPACAIEIRAKPDPQQNERRHFAIEFLPATVLKAIKLVGGFGLFFFTEFSKLPPCLHSTLFRRSTRWKSKTPSTRPERNWPTASTSKEARPRLFWRKPKSNSLPKTSSKSPRST